jgi:hypothetical protein
VEDGNTGEFKIGRTTAAVGVKKRLKQWQRKCNNKLKLVAKWYCKNHENCESLIHTELKLNGFWSGKKQCNSCSGSHYEFFRSLESTLLETVDFWVKYHNVKKN